MHAASAQASIAPRISTAKQLLADWGLELVPISVDVVIALAASLKAGKYRSAALYISAAK